MTTKGWVEGDFTDCAMQIDEILTDLNRRIENG